jgi:hypothetical protein
MPSEPRLYNLTRQATIADCLENEFTAHNLCECDHRQQLEATVQALLPTVDEGTLVKFRPCVVSKELQYLKLGKACGLDGIPNECIRHLPRTPLVRATNVAPPLKDRPPKVQMKFSARILPILTEVFRVLPYFLRTSRK